MRNILLSILFFFGPAMLMFLLRHLGILLRLWLVARKAASQREADVIDVTPRKPHPPSTAFIVVTFVLSLVIAVLVWQRLSESPEVGRIYVPAHINEQGEIVPGHLE
jgi:hypothetical protein